MNQAWIKAQVDELQLESLLELKDIPNIDLYMDQLITLFEDKLSHTKRHSQDKLLTKTMINNYTKDKVLMPAVKKKYTKEHIILMTLLYQLKGIISISDIKDIFAIIKNQDIVEPSKLEAIYKVYYGSREQEIKQFSEGIDRRLKTIHTQMNEKEIEHKDEDLEEVLLIMLLIEQASYHKRLAEKLIDARIKKQKA